jgi:hypothetical protein
MVLEYTSTEGPIGAGPTEGPIGYGGRRPGRQHPARAGAEGTASLYIGSNVSPPKRRRGRFLLYSRTCLTLRYCFSHSVTPISDT